jgi:Ca2+-binding EF-hand superfamily protein
MLADINHDSSIEHGEFSELLKKLNFVVSEDEIFEMFSLINKNKDKHINLQ